MDEYRSLYRKYRPQAPDEVLGQEHVVRALEGAVREGRLSHAFLFSGPRGTGKTSTARILAKMVNCERGPTAEPCGVCEQCERIRTGSHLDVVEIDAASHGGVDDARELRERAPTAPAQGREKVYIIDEAQRLSREAFDALLKLFEEPPPGVRFVLATTEPHKMPATIIGRCQRFEFRRVPAETIAGHISTVARAEGIKIDDAVAEAIAREAEGSVRDALSLLDQAGVLGGGEVTEDVVAALIGTPEADLQFDLADAVAVGDAKGVFGGVQQLVQEGRDLRHFTSRITNHFRNLLLAMVSPDDPAILDVAPELRPRLTAQAGKFSAAELDRILSLLLQAQTDMRWSTAPRLTLELALVRAAMPETDPQPGALLARMERLERLAGLDAQRSGPSEEPSDDRGSGPADRLRGSGGVPPSTSAPEANASSATEGAPVAPPAVSPAPEAGETTGTARAADEAGQMAGEATVAPRQVDEKLASDEAGKGGRTPEPRRSPTGLQAPGPHVPSAGLQGGVAAVDAQMLRRSWPQVVERLKDRRRMQLHAVCALATVGGYEEGVLELVFPPGRTFAVQKVEEKGDELREVLEEMFGVAPKLRCTVREGMVLEPSVEEEEPPASAEDAAALLREQFGAEVVEEE
ncbi:MAG TPA: DNA polymerase III subunit gamma/tau [Actinomycetota bacterium]|jgi:DNA polymerase-3 subunit gamma/tau|nr:DNA polymerase III subunit gamma/tau [Actinomycetota bacterium]